jgi:Spy/CpxP family protein refolding chaperone
MPGSKNLAVMFLLGAVIVGGALGFTADRVMIRDQIATGRTNTRDMRKMFADRLQLTAAQEAKIDSLLDERHRQFQLIRATIQDQLDSVKMHSREQIERVLTDAQKKRFQELLTELGDTSKTRDRDR